MISFDSSCEMEALVRYVSQRVNCCCPSNGGNGGNGGSGNFQFSVGLALPESVFAISGSPVDSSVTNSGTLTGSFIQQPANWVFAGPATGVSGIPAFRPLVAADIPQSALTTGNTPSIVLSGQGTVGVPLVGNVQVSQAPNNAFVILPDGAYVPNLIQSGIVYGGVVTWLGDYNYHVSAAGYWINFQFYESPEAFFTLNPPDSIFNRFDTFIVDINGQPSVLEGTPALDPALAPLDPATQLQLSFALVEVGTTEPTISSECMYRNNLEWTTTSSDLTRINPDSTNLPCNGAKSIEGTTVLTGNNLLLERGSTFSPAATNSLIHFFIRSKAAWVGGVGTYLSFQWENGGVPVGAAVQVHHNDYGFDSTNIVDCQIISIPLFHFGLLSTSVVDSIRITVTATTSIGFYLDDICLQGQALPDPPTSLDEKVGVTPNDLFPGYVTDKFVAGTGIVFSVLNPGADEKFQITATTAGLTFDNGLTRTLDNVQLGGTLLHDTLVDNNSFQFDFVGTHANYVFGVNNSTAGTAGDFSSSGGIGVLGTGVFGGVFNGTTIGVQGFGTTDGSLGGLFGGNYTTTNTSTRVVAVQRTTTGLAAAGLGATIQYDLEDTSGGITAAGSLGMSWVTPTAGTSSSRFNLNLINGGVSARKLAVENTGQLILDEYGAGVFAGSETFLLGVDASGNVIEVNAAGVAAVTANNGLNIDPAQNVQLGGLLVENTTITNNGFNLIVTRAGGGNALRVINTNDTAVRAESNSTAVWGSTNSFANAGVFGQNTGSGYGVHGNSVDGFGVFGEVTGTNAIGVYGTTEGTGALAVAGHFARQIVAASNTSRDIVTISSLSGSSTAGHGGDIVWMLDVSTDPGQNRLAGRVGYRWDDATEDDERSRFRVTVVDNAPGGPGQLEAFNLLYTGQALLNEYGAGTFSGSPAFFLAVDVNGNVIETPVVGGGGGSLSANNGLTENVPDNVQLGGSLIQMTTINTTASYALTVTGAVPNATAEGTLIVNNVSGDSLSSAIYAENTDGIGVKSQATTFGVYATVSGLLGGTGVRGNALLSSGSTSAGVTGYAEAGVAFNGILVNTTNNDVTIMNRFNRGYVGAAVDGIGQKTVYSSTTSSGVGQTTHEVHSKWTTALSGSRVSQYEIWGVDNAILSQQFTLKGSGQLQLNKYGIGTFTGAKTYTLHVDNSGNIIEETPFFVNPENGLTAVDESTFQLGGTLLFETTIDVGSDRLNINGNSGSFDGIFRVNHTGNGNAIRVNLNGVGSGISVVQSGNGNAVGGSAGGSGIGGFFSSLSGFGADISSFTGIPLLVQTQNNTADSGIVPMVEIRRFTSGTPAAGFGGSISFRTETSTGAFNRQSGEIASSWTTATEGSETSKMEFKTTNNTSSAVRLTIAGSGALRAHSYGTGTISGTPAFALSVDASGNIIESALGGAGFTNPMGAVGDIIYSSDGAGTPAALAAGTNGFVLTMVGGLPVWANPAGGAGTVTSASVVTANGFAGSVASATTTPAITITTTQTGLLQGNGTAMTAIANSSTVGQVLRVTGASTYAWGALDLGDADARTGRLPLANIVQGTARSVLGVTGNGAADYANIQGTADQILRVNSAGTALAFGAINLGSASAVTGVLEDDNGGTGQSTYATGDILYASSPNVLAKRTIGSNGQVLTVAGGVPTWVSGATVTSVVGTANRITIGGSPTVTPIIDIAATYVGQTSITTLGTVTTGTWNATTIAPTRGGTGQTLVATGDLLYGSAPNVWSRVGIGTTGQVLTVSAGGVPVWAGGSGGTVTSVSGVLNRTTITGNPAINPTVDISATYVGQASITTLGTIGTGTWQGTAIGATFGGTGQTTWSAGQILYASGVNTLAKLNPGSNGQVLTLVGGIPAWQSVGGVGTVTSVNVSGGSTGFTFSGGPITAAGTMTMGGSLVATFGGTGQTTYATGDILYASAPNVLSKRTIGTAGQTLIVSGGVPTWGQLSLTTGVTGDLPFANMPQLPGLSVAGVAGSATADMAAITAATDGAILRRSGTTLGFGAINLASVSAVGTSVLQPINGGLGTGSITSNRVLVTTASGYAQVLPTFGNGVVVTMGPGTMSVTGQFNPTRQTLVDGSTITWNVLNGESAVVTLGNTGRTLTITNPTAGRTYVIEVVQDGTGNRTITTYPAGTLWGTAGVPVLGTTPGARDLLSFYYNGTNFLATRVDTY